VRFAGQTAYDIPFDFFGRAARNLHGSSKRNSDPSAAVNDLLWKVHVLSDRKSRSLAGSCPGDDRTEQNRRWCFPNGNSEGITASDNGADRVAFAKGRGK
jgi:hypothetical protein